MHLSQVLEFETGPSRSRSPEFTREIHRRFPISVELWKTISLFTDIELKYDPLTDDQAERMIRGYFDTMCAFLYRYNDSSLSFLLSPESYKIASSLRVEIFKKHNLTEEDEDRKKREAIAHFSDFYARIRHGENCIRHPYQTILQSSRYLLPKLHEMGLLQAWDFTDDLEYVNMLGMLLSEKHSPILGSPYNFEVEGKVLTGILPTIDIRVCPRA